MDCPNQEVLVAHSLGRLSGPESNEIRDHVSTCSSCAERVHVTQSLAASNWTSSAGLSAAAAPVHDSATAYRVHGEHARGGIGRILRAEDLRLNRPVALKELISDNPSAARRFAREATLTARLQHPSIVPVYEAGTWPNGQPFYAMKFISGRPLSQLIADAGTLERRMVLLPHVIAVAEAIAYAHSQRVIHRDLKPSNILVGEFGETMVVDWGLGKVLGDHASDAAADELEAGASHGASDETALGAVLGTPAFMAPEQATSAPVDERADVYAIGAMLYTLLAGRLPYAGEHSSDVLAQVRAGAPPALDRVQPGVPPDLLAIVAKAMARAPADRYADASALAHDLKRYQSGQLVGVRHYSFGELLRRWVVRHRLPVTLSATFVLALAAVGFVSVRRVLRERDISQARSNEMILAGARATLDRDPTATLAWLKQYPLDGPAWEEVREVALKATSDGAARYLFQSPDEVPFPSFSPDGRQLAVPLEGAANRVDVRDTASGKLVRSFPLDRVHAWGTRWSPDGTKLFALSYLIEKQAVEWWGLDSGQHHAVPTGELSAPVAVAADGSGFAVAERGKGVRVVGFDGQSRQLVTRGNETPTLQYLDGGKQLLAVDQKGNVDVCNVADQHCLSWTVGWHANGAAVSPDESRFVVFGAQVEVRARDGKT
ncbi:MAG TPA: protein kinase, partial [Polyangia bacterium]|nr:protein kinase [Polyangia bacterium]